MSRQKFIRLVRNYCHFTFIKGKKIKKCWKKYLQGEELELTRTQRYKATYVVKRATVPASHPVENLPLPEERTQFQWGSNISPDSYENSTFLFFLANYPFWYIWKPNYPQNCRKISQKALKNSVKKIYHKGGFPLISYSFDIFIA